MAEIPHNQARNLLVVNPDTGFQIMHVKATDPQKGYLEVYSVTACPLDTEFWMVVNGQKVPYTFIEMRDADTGARFFSAARYFCRFDVINKHTGEVIHEVDGPKVPTRLTDPAGWALEVQQKL